MSGGIVSPLRGGYPHFDCLSRVDTDHCAQGSASTGREDVAPPLLFLLSNQTKLNFPESEWLPPNVKEGDRGRRATPTRICMKNELLIREGIWHFGNQGCSLLKGRTLTTPFWPQARERGKVEHRIMTSLSFLQYTTAVYWTAKQDPAMGSGHRK